MTPPRKGPHTGKDGGSQYRRVIDEHSTIGRYRKIGYFSARYV